MSGVNEVLKRLEAGLPPPEQKPPPPSNGWPFFLLSCGILASIVLFIDGCHFVSTRWSMDWPDSEANHQGWQFIGLALFVGPLLFGIAAVLHRLDRLNQKKSGIGYFGHCPMCGGPLLGMFPKCPHCAGDVVWEHGVAMTAQQAAVDRQRRELTAAELGRWGN